MRAAIKTLVGLGLGVAFVLWLVGLPGSVELRFGDLFVAITVPAAIVLLVAAFLILHLLLRGIAWLRGWPARRRARRRERERTEGESAMTRAFVALAAGRGEPARLEIQRARKLLGDTPQLLLLTAEAGRATNREDEVTEAFERLAETPETRFLGLRGLLRQAVAAEDWDRAQMLAREAEKAEPGAEWVRAERAQLAYRRQDWREALAVAGPQGPRAALSLAAAGQEPDPVKAAELERQAFAADPSFAPAALAYGARLRANGQARKADQVLEQCWAYAPHPDVAAALLDGIENPAERQKRTEDFTRGTVRHPESRLIRARTALDAGMTGRARAELEAWHESGDADRRCHALMAEVIRAEQGDEAAAREAAAPWLRDAERAPRAPAWRCGHCGATQERWAPLCQSCGTAGELRWSGRPAA